jgi:hypothetical protein
MVDSTNTRTVFDKHIKNCNYVDNTKQRLIAWFQSHPATEDNGEPDPTPAPIVRNEKYLSQPIDCDRYQTDSENLYTILNNTDPLDYHYMLLCLKEQVKTANGPLNDLMNHHTKNKIGAITASEMYKNTRSIYNTDLYYTISKIFLFIELIIAYIYFFKDSGILQPIRDSATFLNEGINKLKDFQVPKIKMPEVTMPSIKMPNGAK